MPWKFPKTSMNSLSDELTCLSSSGLPFGVSALICGTCELFGLSVPGDDLGLLAVFFFGMMERGNSLGIRVTNLPRICRWCSSPVFSSKNTNAYSEVVEFEVRET